MLKLFLKCANGGLQKSSIDWRLLWRHGHWSWIWNEGSGWGDSRLELLLGRRGAFSLGAQQNEKSEGGKGGVREQNEIWKRICQLASPSARLYRTDSFSLSLVLSVFPFLSLSFCLLSSLPPKRCRLVVSLPFSLLLARSLLTSPHTQYFARCCWLGLLFCALIGQLDVLEPALIICLWES